MNEFRPHFVVFKNENLELPLTIGGLTQKGSNSDEDKNNQDAMSIVAIKKTIIAVVCDGCSSGSGIGQNIYSHNEFAAQSLSVLAVKHIQEFISKENDINENIVLFLEERLLSDLKNMLSLFESEILYFNDHIIMELFLSTIVAVIVVDEKWYVLHGGDGLVIINGDITDLDKNNSGSYIANILHSQSQNKQNTIKLLANGNVSDIKHILIATDGVSEFIRKDKERFLLLCDEVGAPKKGYNPGYDEYFFREFRKRFSNQWEGDKKERPDHDDRTFILIRRIPCTAEEKPIFPSVNNAGRANIKGQRKMKKGKKEKRKRRTWKTK